MRPPAVVGQRALCGVSVAMRMVPLCEPQARGPAVSLESLIVAGVVGAAFTLQVHSSKLQRDFVETNPRRQISAHDRPRALRGRLGRGQTAAPPRREVSGSVRWLDRRIDIGAVRLL